MRVVFENYTNFGTRIIFVNIVYKGHLRKLRRKFYTPTSARSYIRRLERKLKYYERA